MVRFEEEEMESKGPEKPVGEKGKMVRPMKVTWLLVRGQGLVCDFV